MDENKITIAKKDKRVNYNFLINNINVFSALPSSNPEKIIIYCHGLGSNKNWAIRFYNQLLENNIGLFAFDFPGHGEDKTEFSKFDLSLCMVYLNQVIKYVKKNYSSKIYLFGCSYGGFVILNKIIQNSDFIEKVVLMCPAINFCEILERKMNISSKYFENNNYILLYNNIKIYKKAYLEFKQGNFNIKKFKFKNVSIIHGTDDKTVFISDIQKFCLDNNLYLEIIDSGKHELYDYDFNIIKFILNVIND